MPRKRDKPTKIRKSGRARTAASEALTTPDLVVLALLAEKPWHGYELNQELVRREVRDWAGVSRPQVYYSLNKLQWQGMIRPSGAKVTRTGAKRQVFSLSGRGRAALADALERPSWATTRVPPPFLTWLALSPHARPGSAARQLERRREFLRAELDKEKRTLAAIRQDTGPMIKVAALMVELTIRQMQVELEWLGG